jgi:hypothetical protein
VDNDLANARSNMGERTLLSDAKGSTDTQNNTKSLDKQGSPSEELWVIDTIEHRDDLSNTRSIGSRSNINGQE